MSHQKLCISAVIVSLGLCATVRAQRMYWNEGTAAKVSRADLDGTNLEELVTELSGPVGLAVDPTQCKMYWTDLNDGTIHRANLDGSDVEQLLANWGECP